MPSFISISSRPKVLVLGPPKFGGEDYLEEFRKSYDVEILTAPTRADLIHDLPALISSRGPFTALVCRMDTAPYEPFDAELLSPLLPHLRIVASGQAGYNDFDVDWMTANGVWFCNTRNAISEATADLALYLVLAVVRDAHRAERSFRAGRWRSGATTTTSSSNNNNNNNSSNNNNNDDADADAAAAAFSIPTLDPHGMTLGIVGMGATGRLLARKASLALGMRIAYTNARGAPLAPADEAYFCGSTANATFCSTLDDLLRVADVVSLHCPLTPATRGLIGARELGIMKTGAFLVNTARGGVVDEDALVEALESGRVRRAGLDVFEGEPVGGGGGEGKEGGVRRYFMESDKVVVQPHMGGLTQGSWRRAQRECFENVRAFCETGRPVAPVNEVVGGGDGAVGKGAA